MQTLIRFQEFIDELAENNGRLYKISVLEKYKYDRTVREYLYFLLNPYITTGIAEKKLFKHFSLEDGLITRRIDFVPQMSYLELLDYISKNNTGKDVDVQFVGTYMMKQLPKELWPLACKLLIKDLPIGVDAKTVNSVIPELIPTFNVQLANKYFDNPKVVNGKEFTLTTKIDGSRIIAIKKNGIVKFYSRKGQECEGLVDLKKELEQNFPDNLCLDGELTLLDKGNMASGDQYKATMKLSRTKDKEKHGLKMLVFDCMTADEFNQQRCDTAYVDRRAKLDYLFKGFSHPKRVYFSRLPVLYTGNDTNKITEILNEQVAAGEEGIMININDAPYHFSRTNDLLKCKLFNDADLEVIGFTEGTNKNKGKLGAFICRYGDNTVKVSDMSDEIREEVWHHKDEWLGRTIVVKYFEESYNSKTGKKSLRFPVYLDYRTDK